MHDRLPEPGADECAFSERLSQQLRGLITARGPLPFSQYMERCLYAPGLGYYSAGATKFGAAGDFVTAPELGGLFAGCVARCVGPVLAQLGEDTEVLELGGGSGALAEHLLGAWAAAGTLPRAYRILEPSADLRQRQRQRLASALAPSLFARVHWLDHPPDHAWQGVLLANEVIDALPVTRFTVQDGEVFEEHVALDATGAFIRIDRPANAQLAHAVRQLERDLGNPFANGYRSEWLPQLPSWMQAVADTLHAGLMLFVDYGYVRREFYLPERRDGTLRAFYRHRAHADPFFLPGLNDLTASVDFTALAEAGQAAGFQLAAYLPQSLFLAACGLQEVFERAFAQAGDEAARYRLAQEARRLMLPEQMGERFQAMAFSRQLDLAALLPELPDADQRHRL